MAEQFRATRLHIDKGTYRKDAVGRLHIRGRLTKTGVFPYRVGDETVNEYRPEEEVFNEDSLKTLKGAPVTIDHPSAFVAPKDMEVVGIVTEVTVDSPYVEGELILFDDKAIKLVEQGRLKEVSLGYETDLEEGDSTEYDLVQRNIRYNHAALGPENWARLGRDLTIRADGTTPYLMELHTMNEQTETELDISVEITDSTAPEVEEVTAEEETPEEVVSEDAEEEAQTEPADEPTEDEAEEEKEVTDSDRFDSIEAKLDALLEALAPKAEEKKDSVDAPSIEEQVKAAVTAALAEQKKEVKREYSALTERVLGKLPETQKPSSLRDRIMGKE